MTEFKQSGDTLPAGNPVIVKSEDAVNETFEGPSDEAATVKANGLVGFYQSGAEVPAGAYVLQTQNDEQGFYKVGSTEVNGVKNRCYLPAPTEAEEGSPAQARFRIVIATDVEETALEEVNSESSAAAVFTPDGTQIAAPQRGLNIMKMTDGTVKKVIINQ